MPSFASMQIGNGPEICQLPSLCDISCHMETLHLDVKKTKQCTITILDTSQTTMPLPLLLKEELFQNFEILLPICKSGIICRQSNLWPRSDHCTCSDHEASAVGLIKTPKSVLRRLQMVYYGSISKQKKC